MKIPTHKTLLFVLMWTVVAAFGAQWVWQTSQTQLVVENLSKNDFTDVVIIVADSTIRAGTLKADAKSNKAFWPQSDSAFHIRGLWRDRELSSSLGYTTANDGMQHAITLTPDGELLYSVTR